MGLRQLKGGCTGPKCSLLRFGQQEAFLTKPNQPIFLGISAAIRRLVYILWGLIEKAAWSCSIQQAESARP